MNCPSLITINFGTFSSLQKETSYPLAVDLPPHFLPHALPCLSKHYIFCVSVDVPILDTSYK